MSGDRVRVYLLPLPLAAHDADALERVLTPDELAQGDTYISEAGRMKFVARRGALRILLGKETGVPPAAVVLERDRWGKPRLREPAGVHFNISDTDGMVAIALATEREVGVDVEWLKPRRFDGLARSTFTRDELAAFRSAPEARRPGAFYEQWTSKEAYSKAMGLGLRLPFRRTQVGELALEPAPIPCSATFAGARIEAGDQHRAALVAEGAGWRPEVRVVDSVAELTA